MLRELYAELPPLVSVPVRSFTLSRYGPTLTLRLDLPVPAGGSLPPWTGGDAGRVQCHLCFLAVDDLRLSRWDPPAAADVTLAARPSRRVRARVAGPGVELAFTASDSLTVAHVSVFRPGADGTDQVPHRFASPLDRKLFGTVPDVCEKTFHGHD
ncbi:hypothetical protein GCM10027168_16640 [Streptomyces capparidis]